MAKLMMIAVIFLLLACSRPLPAATPTPAPPAPPRAAPTVAVVSPRPSPPPVAPAEVIRPAETGRQLAERASIQLEITHVTTYKNSTGAVVIQGVVQNQSPMAVGPVEIAVSLLSESGATVTSGHALHKPTALQSGSRAPWSAIVRNVPAFKEVRVQAQARPMDDLIAQFIYQDLRSDGVTTVPAAPPFNLPKISGQVINTGSRTAALVHVLVAVYADDGQLLAVDMTTTKLSELAPGQSAPFEFNFLTANNVMKGQTVQHYELFIQGLPKS